MLSKHTVFLNDEPAEEDKPGEVEECSRVSGELKWALNLSILTCFKSENKFFTFENIEKKFQKFIWWHFSFQVILLIINGNINACYLKQKVNQLLDCSPFLQLTFSSHFVSCIDLIPLSWSELDSHPRLEHISSKESNQILVVVPHCFHLFSFYGKFDVSIVKWNVLRFRKD